MQPVHLHIPIDLETRNKIKAAAAIQGKTMSQFVIQAVRSAMETR